MPWPTGSVSTSQLDAGNDSPGLARAAILAAVQNVNEIVAMRGQPNGIAALGADSLVPAAQGGMPCGAVIPFAGAAAPTGWALCFGQAVSRTTFAALFAVIGTTYGAGDGSTTFNLPDLRGRTVAGEDDMGGTAANRLTTGGSGINGAALGASGGAQTHTLTVAEIPAHSHNLRFTSVLPNNGVLNGVNSAGTGTAIPGTDGGGGGAHNNVQPTLVLNYIIKT